MTNQSGPDTRQYMVIVNKEGQYSLWLGHRSIPNGWKSTGTIGDKVECLDWVKKNWLDMRPRSLEYSMDAIDGRSAIAVVN